MVLAILEILNVNNGVAIEIWVKGHPRSLKIKPFNT